MKILLLGSGGREHALAIKLTESATPVELFAAPGSDAISGRGTCLPYSVDDKASLLGWAAENRPDLVVIGPEAPLVGGMSDEFARIGIPVFGHPAATSKLEGSKSFAKEFMFRNSVPCAASKTVSELGEGEAAINDWAYGFPIVVKADGLAAGKGVELCQTKQEALETLRAFLAGKFGDASKTVVLEEPLFGMELSLHVLVDVTENGAAYCMLPACQDHKRIFENDLGPNTGGMGAFGPIPFLREEDVCRMRADLVEPTIKGMQSDGLEGRGVLFLGIIWTKVGPKLLEYNVRFGDPETQVLMQLLDEDLPNLLFSVATHKLERKEPRVFPGTAICVVLAAQGYPGPPQKGADIEIKSPKCSIIHAGTIKSPSGWKVGGGRVVNLAVRAGSLEEARSMVLEDLAQVGWPDMQVRRDIGLKALLHARSGKTVEDLW
ncbi:MAG: phosphoribosylamine--glycine ligase [Holophagales bacterium]|jgi:phosphoribosylamine--glycine ligase|nr:phosphoribosylamine--glycine ligase [Holophagales bacterium]